MGWGQRVEGEGRENETPTATPSLQTISTSPVFYGQRRSSSEIKRTRRREFSCVCFDCRVCVLLTLGSLFSTLSSRPASEIVSSDSDAWPPTHNPKGEHLPLTPP